MNVEDASSPEPPRKGPAVTKIPPRYLCAACDEPGDRRDRLREFTDPGAGTRPMHDACHRRWLERSGTDRAEERL